jgi:cobalt-zinc-cadmium efflux system outer membrane protein
MLTSYRFLPLLLLCGCQAVLSPRSIVEVVVEDESADGLVKLASYQDPVEPSLQPAPLEESGVIELPAPTESSESSLTLADLEERALAQHPGLMEGFARRDALIGKRIQEGVCPNPQIGYSGQQLFSNGEAEQHGIYLGRDFVPARKRFARQAVVTEEITKQDLQNEVQRQRVLTDVRLSYYRVLVAQQRLELTQELVHISEETVKTAKKMFEALVVGRVDVIRLETERQSVMLQQKKAEADYQATWTGLAILTGLPTNTPQFLDGRLDDFADTLSYDEALQHLLQQSPAISVAEAEVGLSHSTLNRELAEKLGDVEVQTVVQSDNGTGRANANVQVSVPLLYSDWNQGAIRQARAELVAADRAVDTTRLKLEKKLALVYAKYVTSRNIVTEYSKPNGILETSLTALKLVREGYELTELLYVDLLSAQRKVSQANLTYLDALDELWAASIEIEGLLLKDSLGSD